MYFFVIASWASGLKLIIVVLIFFLVPGLNWCTFLYVWFVRNVHRIIGYLTLAWSMWTMLSGLFSYNSNIKYIMIIHIVGYFVAWLILEIIHCVRWKNRLYGSHFGFHKVKRLWTMERFLNEIKNGKRLALFEDCVVDLRFFVHPGGQFFFEHCIGQDIGQYLNGSLTNMDKAKTHTHSSYAYRILRSLVIAWIVSQS